ncbi:hypothetical protein KOW79_016742 [Hemibagrus wyckioides]|uniref:Uncharacterized protein n=1 Tax=Hemibagrus wyckioides TaxID=337641 RepID=A0A9D3NBW2_9TELE|nr:hypothetical protein KOW79_016742 [Hemibagrus wyckioides]
MQTQLCTYSRGVPSVRTEVIQQFLNHVLLTRHCSGTERISHEFLKQLTDILYSRNQKLILVLIQEPCWDYSGGPALIPMKTSLALDLSHNVQPGRLAPCCFTMKISMGHENQAGSYL